MKHEPDQQSTNEVELGNAAVGVSCLVLYVRLPSTVRYIVMFFEWFSGIHVESYMSTVLLCYTVLSETELSQGGLVSALRQ